jgi:hypothetical protein
MARLRLPRELGWMEYEDWMSYEDGRWWGHISAKPKRWYALRPSFWLFAIRHLRLRPYEAQPIETDDR